MEKCELCLIFWFISPIFVIFKIIQLTMPAMYRNPVLIIKSDGELISPAQN